MKHRVTGKQENSKMCFICGLKNRFGLYTSFYETENGQLIAVFTPRQEHQGYPGRLHGGIAAAILDETIGRAVNTGKSGIWGVTLDFNIKYKKPVPLSRQAWVIGRINKENSRIFEGSGEIVLEDGTVAAEGSGRYLKMPIEKIADFDLEENEWKIVISDKDPEVIEI